jgi:hypothetical protein
MNDQSSEGELQTNFWPVSKMKLVGEKTNSQPWSEQETSPPEHSNKANATKRSKVVAQPVPDISMQADVSFAD